MTIFIIIATVIFSVISFPRNVQSIEAIRKPEWFNKFLFNAYQVIQRKEWYRVFTSGFLHANWMHLAFNMMTLYFFGDIVQAGFVGIFGQAGIVIYLLFYILAIGASSIFDLVKYKNDHSYNAIGASGAVSAVLFAVILFEPKISFFLFFIPIPIPALIFGPLFLIYSQFMAKKKLDNIGHNAHFWGAIFGFFFPLLLRPTLLIDFFDKIF